MDSCNGTSFPAANKSLIINYKLGNETMLPLEKNYQNKTKFLENDKYLKSEIQSSSLSSLSCKSSSSEKNCFLARPRRHSASIVSSSSQPSSQMIHLTPRVSQLRQESVDVNSREVIHERKIHNVLQISQSWEDLTIVAENWSFKSSDSSNNNSYFNKKNSSPLFNRQNSSPSPTSGISMKIRMYSPSPTRKKFATRRSISPIAMRPSKLGTVKRKFELEETIQSPSSKIKCIEN